MQTMTFLGAVVGECALIGPQPGQVMQRGAATLRSIARERTKMYLTIRGLIAIRLTSIHDDPGALCEYGNGCECDARACAWTIEQGSGYVVACGQHAQAVLLAAVEAGEIYRLDINHNEG